MSVELKRNLAKLYAKMILGVGVAATIGWFLDRSETLRLTRFRDKSALFGRELKPGEPPSWP